MRHTYRGQNGTRVVRLHKPRPATSHDPEAAPQREIKSRAADGIPYPTRGGVASRPQSNRAVRPYCRLGASSKVSETAASP